MVYFRAFWYFLVYFMDRRRRWKAGAPAMPAFTEPGDGRADFPDSPGVGRKHDGGRTAPKSESAQLLEGYVWSVLFEERVRAAMAEVFFEERVRAAF